MVCQDWHGEPGQGAGYGKGDKGSGGQTGRYSRFLGHCHQEHHYDGVSGAAPIMDADQVPEGHRPHYLPQENLGSELGRCAALQPAHRVTRIRPQGTDADVRRFVVKQPD